MVFSAAPHPGVLNPRTEVLTAKPFKRLLGVPEGDEIPPPLFAGLDAVPPTFHFPGMDVQTTRFYLEQFAVMQRISETISTVYTGYRTAIGDVVINLVAGPNEPVASGTDYATMSVRELKRVLAARGVSCVGMVEKAELVAACCVSGAR